MRRKYADYKHGVLLGSIILLLFMSPFPEAAGAMGDGKPGVGDQAPLFSVDDLGGVKTSLGDILQSGKAVLINFWGLRCSSCIEEIAYLNALHGRYSGKGVVFLGVNVDGAKPETVRNLMPKMANVPLFTVLPDPEMKIPDMYNMMGAPLSLVVAKDGKITYRHEDFRPGDEKGLEEAIVKSLPRPD